MRSGRRATTTWPSRSPKIGCGAPAWICWTRSAVSVVAGAANSFSTWWGDFRPGHVSRRQINEIAGHSARIPWHPRCHDERRARLRAPGDHCDEHETDRHLRQPLTVPVRRLFAAVRPWSGAVGRARQRRRDCAGCAGRQHPNRTREGSDDDGGNDLEDQGVAGLGKP